MKFLVTGGTGYIGSHAVLALLQTGADVVVLDNLCNSAAESLNCVSKITGRTPVFVQGDVRDRALLDKIFAEYRLTAVLNFLLASRLW